MNKGNIFSMNLFDSNAINNQHKTLKDNSIKNIHKLFKEQVIKNPQYIAINYKDIKLSYEEVDILSDKVCYLIQELDITTNKIVGICMNYSVEMIITIIGVLKAGGSILMNAQFSDELILDKVEEFNPELIITKKGMQNYKYKQVEKILEIDLNKLRELNLDYKILNISNNAESIAYILYYENEFDDMQIIKAMHKSICKNIYHIKHKECEKIGNSIIDNTLPLEMLIYGVFLTLSTGGCLVIVEYKGNDNYKYLIRDINLHKISSIYLSSLTLKKISTKIDQCETLKYIICNNEISFHNINRDMLDSLYNARIKLYNIYSFPRVGISAISSPNNHMLDRAKITIGNPVRNIYILDKYMKQVPIGERGEVFIGINSLEVYFNKQESSEMKFIKNSFDQKSDLLYKTDEVASILSNGSIKFLGKKDLYVNINNYEIYTGEIEILLNQYPGIEEGIIIPWKDRSDEYLIAVIRVKRKSEINIEDFKCYLTINLAKYMIPNKIYILEDDLTKD